MTDMMQDLQTTVTLGVAARGFVGHPPTLVFGQLNPIPRQCRPPTCRHPGADPTLDAKM